jgi:hypothetical protein
MRGRTGPSSGTGRHVSVDLLDRYAASASNADGHGSWWAVEAHLETCAPCRDRLRDVVELRSPSTTLLLERVREELGAEVDRSPRLARRRLWNRLPRGTWWAAPAVLQRLGMTVLVVAVALLLDLADGAARGRAPSLVLLLAPVAPLVGVAAVWARGLDPAHEVVQATARAGLDLVLRRTLAVLTVVVPVLALAGWVVGMSPARWLLPCLAFTAGALVLGERFGLHRAATGLVLAWTAGVVAPSLVVSRSPDLLTTASLPAWSVAFVVVLVVLVARRGAAYTSMRSSR